MHGNDLNEANYPCPISMLPSRKTCPILSLATMPIPSTANDGIKASVRFDVMFNLSNIL